MIKRFLRRIKMLRYENIHGFCLCRIEYENGVETHWI